MAESRYDMRLNRLYLEEEKFNVFIIFAAILASWVTAGFWSKICVPYLDIRELEYSSQLIELVTKHNLRQEPITIPVNA